MGQFAAVQAVQHILGILLALALHVGLLNAASRGGVVVGYGEAYHAPVG